MTYSCIDKAIETYLERIDKDTNQMIVQMMSPISKELIDHWYYRSDQFISQPYDLPFLNINPYIGSPYKAPAKTYGKNTFVADLEVINEAKTNVLNIRRCLAV